MKRTVSLAALVAVFVGLPLSARAATSCSVVADDPTQKSQIRVDGATLDVPPSRNLKDCTGISVAAGRVVLMFETATGDLKTEACGANEPRCAVPSGAKPILSRIVAMLEGAPERRAAGKRYDEDARRLEGLPSGKIYSLERAGLFDLRALGTGGWALVVTREPGRAQVLQRSGSEPVVQLPRGLLQRGGKYGWVLTTAGKRFTGGFDVLAQPRAAEVERDLRQAGVTDGPRTRKQKIDELMVLFDHDLDHEVRLLYRELGL